MKDYSALLQQADVAFKDISLLDRAFVHRSYLNEHEASISNERLEFLGDAVLELVVTDYLYKNFPNKSEGVLTSYRSALVCGLNLAKVGRSLDLGSYLYLGKGEDRSGGRDKDHLLANVVEALIGAVYLDQGYEVSNKFIHEWVLTTLEGILAQKLYIDAKTAFQEKVQEIKNITPSYNVHSEDGPDHKKQFVIGAYIGEECVGEGQGHNKQEAQEAAARDALIKQGWLDSI